MSQPEELVRALLGELCGTDADAGAVLSAARSLDIDPLDYCAHRYRLGADEVARRAAAWADLAFSPVVPNHGPGRITVRRFEGLAEARSVRGHVFDREVIYIAPHFEELIRLKDYARQHPEVRSSTCIAPPGAIRGVLVEANAQRLLEEAWQRLSRRWPFASAHLDLGLRARFAFVVGMALLTGSAVLAPQLMQLILLPFVALVLLAPAVFRLVAVLSPPRDQPRMAPPLRDAELPVYSVLIPLRDEAHMLPLLHRAMTALDYPPERLDIKFVVEGRSVSTVAAVRPLLEDPRFELVVVPEAPPFTKPKALDYALPLVRGQHVVVYDAEDIPNPDQLRLAAAAFAGRPGVDCLQAELLIDNARENLLTGLFAGEYAGQFGMVLPALTRWNLPVPLGGTSNHFRTSALREIGGWDAFNVTEDADLGVRLSRLRLRTAMLLSQTYEEAPVTLGVWMRQRTRWMKGWMQTFIVHNRRPVALWRDLGWKGFLAFEVYVGSMILSPLLHTAFVAGIITVVLAGQSSRLLLDTPLMIIEVLVLLIGYGSSFGLAATGLMRLGQRRLLLHQALLPAYWLLHAIATVRAGYELVTRPHFWAKTAHGLTRLERTFGLQPGEPAMAEHRQHPGKRGWGRRRASRRAEARSS